MAEPRDPREPRIPKESPPFDADNKWTRTWIMYFESLFTLSVKEAVRQTLEVAVTHTSGDLTKDLPVFGNDKADVKVGTKTGNTTEVATVSGAVVTGNTVKWDTHGNLIDAGLAPSGSTGTVTHTGGALTADQPVFGAGSADIKVGTKTGNTNKLVSNTGTNVTGNTVKWDASGNLIDAGSTPGAGTVTSVALTVPAEFSVSGSPVTTSGTLAVSKATQSSNTVYAGPTTGSAAAPTFRAVVPADLPLASSAAFGAVKVDGTTITASSGVISAAGGGGGGGLLIPTITPITVANWTTLGSGGTRTNTTGPGGGGAINIISTTGGSGNIYGAYRTVAAGDFTHDFILYADIPYANFAEVQLGFTDGTKTEGVCIISISVTNSLQCAKCSALSGGTYATGDGAVYTAWFQVPGNPLLIRLARVGTALKGYASFNGGITYVLLFNDTGPYLTASALFFSCDPRSSVTPAFATLISSTLV